tara:strand:- start:1396 stop:2199 length:804 start_codon:yes stop_codon:yes gene_type:complete
MSKASQKKSKPLVSIIMNCHNGEKFLRQSIKSIKNQTYSNWELIFWDNKSTDHSKKIIKTYSDKRIKYFKSKNFLNLYNARNLAIKKAKGKYISFLDVDDLWKKNKLKKQVSYLKKNKDFKIVYSNFTTIDNLKNKKYVYYKNLLPCGNITQKLLNNYQVGILTVMLEKKLFNDQKFNNSYNIIGDFDFFLNLSTKYKFGCIQEYLAYYRIHGENYSKIKHEIYIKEIKNWISRNQKKMDKLSFTINPVKRMLTKLKIKYILKFLGA